MRDVRRRGRQNHLGIAGQFQGSRDARSVRDRQPPDFDIVFRRNGDVGVDVDAEIATMEFGPGLREDRLINVGFVQRRLIGRRPDVAARRVAQVAEQPAIVARAVLVPAGDGCILPAAVARRRHW